MADSPDQAGYGGLPGGYGSKTEHLRFSQKEIEEVKKMDYRKAVALAKEGKEEGFHFLYEATYRSKYYLALQYMKNGEAAKDVLQDAYIKAFSKLDQLKEPDAFPGWLGRIVANTAKNKLERNEPLLFSDVGTDEDAEGFEYRIEDETIENQPELSYTKQEVRDLVHELIGSLSEEQRMCILLFYIEGASIKEIAATLDCSENTVKSRLNYGRKNLKAKAEQLQKKGYRLYGVAPLPLLLFLLWTQEAGLSESGAFAEAGREVAKEIFRHSAAPKSMASSGIRHTAEGGAKTAAKTAAKSGFLHTAAGKAVAVIVCACIAGGVIYGASTMAPQPAETEIAAQETEEAAPERTPEATPEPTARELSEAEYPELLAGQLTKEEMEFVLAYGPDEIPEGGFTSSDYTDLINSLCQGSDSENGAIENYGTNEQWESQYSIGDINRLFSMFTGYRLAEGNEPSEMFRISGDTLVFFPATLSYTAAADITKTEYTDGELDIYYTYVHNSYENGESTSFKKAVLMPNEDGVYQIVRIEEAGQPTGTPAAEATPEAGGAAIGELYAGALDESESGSDYYFVYDMNGDGIQELIVGTEFAETAFIYSDIRVYTCEKQAAGYVLKPISGEVTTLGLCIAEDGNGLFTQDISRGTGAIDIYRITIQDGALVRGDSEQEYTLGDAGYQEFGNANPTVEWLELSDRSALAVIG